MRIISKYRDYYDVMNDGSEAERVWKRETSSFLPDMNDPFYKTDSWENELPRLMDPVSIPRPGAACGSLGFWRWQLDDYRRSLLLFCGEFYPFVRLPEKICWNFDDFARIVHLDERPYAKRNSMLTRKEVYALTQAMFTREKILHRFKTLNLRLRCPIVLLDIQEQPLGPLREHEPERFRLRFTLNPRLEDLDFASIIPPFDAFQKLETYLFNELAEQKDPPVEISDTIRRDNHGFDRHSFRKDASGKKQ